MPANRSANQSHHVQVDLEIENTLRRLRKEVRLNTMAIARQQTLKELVAPNVENQPLCINIDNNVNLELKSGFIQSTKITSPATAPKFVAMSRSHKLITLA